MLYLAQELSRGQDTSQCAPLAVFHGPIREVQQVAVDGQKVGGTSKRPSEPDQVLIVRVCLHGASNHVLGRVPDDLGSMVQQLTYSVASS